MRKGIIGRTRSISSKKGARAGKITVQKLLKQIIYNKIYPNTA
jgi:hypothetical protein